MIKINFSPVRSDDAPLTADWAAPVLTVNGVAYDLSLLEDGATAEHPVLGTVHRIGSDYECTLKLPHGPEQWQPTGQVDPTVYTVAGIAYTDRATAITEASALDPAITTVTITADHHYQHASEAQRFPLAVTLTADGSVPVPFADTKTETQPAGDVEAFRAEAWPITEELPE